jgi:hypothetical protein|tara:strand:+ start:7719 stop:8147 length:429 start_codon:yes stop_codon:yes gene_type:complete
LSRSEPQKITKQQLRAAESGAIRAVQEYMTALNDADHRTLFERLHIPHIRIAGEHVTIYQTRKELEEKYLRGFMDRAGVSWKYTMLDSVEVMQASEKKVHLFIQWTRYDEQERAITTQQALWVMRKIDGKWGAQARSSFAPE